MKGVYDVIKTKFAKVVSMALAMVLTIDMFTPSGVGLSVRTYAASNVQTDRADEGKKNISDDIDFWNDINVDHSFAHQVRMATNYANRQVSAGNTIGGGNGVDDVYGSSLDMSNIAPFFGYSSGEVEYDELNSPENTRSAATDRKNGVFYSVDSVASSVVTDRTSSVSWLNLGAGYEYYSYGLLLNLTGLDSVGTSATDQTRNLYGLIAQGSYLAASSVNMIFETCFKFLQATNPFVFFKDINVDVGKNELSAIDAEATAVRGGDSAAVNSVASFFGKIFNMFTNFAWTVSIPLSLLFIIITYFLTRRGRYYIGSNLKKFVVKVVFIAMGIPILGSAYTQVLDGLADTQSASDEFITQAVSYTFVDFASWVASSRLDPPADATLGIFIGSQNRLSNSVVDTMTIRNLRKTCNAINVASNVFKFSGTNGLTTSKNSGILIKDYIYSTGTGANLATSTASTASESYSNRQAVSDLLKSYTNGTKYTATMFESSVVAWMQSKKSSVISYGDMFALSADKYSFSQNAERKIHWLQGTVDSDTIKYDPTDSAKTSTYADVARARFATSNDFAGVGYNIWNNGKLWGRAIQHPSGTVMYSFTGIPAGDSTYGIDCSKLTGFSTMSMYTYLTSEFTQTGITAYGDSSSGYTQEAHYAINLIGGNALMQFAFLSNMVAVLLGYFFLAVVYVFRTVFDILFKGFQIMGHALLAAVGFYKSIGTCICMVVNMIAQLFITVIFFSFMTDVLFMCTSIFDEFFFGLFDKVTGYLTLGSSDQIASAYAADVLVTLSSLLSAFVIVFFVSFAIKWRSYIMSMINSMVENVIGTLLGVNLSGSSDGVMGGMAKAALNDAVNVAGVAAGVGGGVALAGGVQDMINDMDSRNDIDSDSAEQIVNDNAQSAVDAAVNPSVGSGFDGGSGAEEGDRETKAIGEDALMNGLDSDSDGHDVYATGHGGAGGRIRGETESTDRADSEGVSEADAETDEQESEAHYGGSYESYGPEYSGSVSGSAFAGPVPMSGFGSVSDIVSSDVKDNLELSGDTSDTEELGNNRANNVADSISSVSTAATGAVVASDSMTTAEAESGTEWTQDDAENQISSGISFDPTRGIVMTSVGEDGTSSDVAIGMNGLSLGSTDADGNKTVNTISTDGITTAYTGADGSAETVTTTFDGLNSNVTVERTDADGNSETITSGLNGSTVERVETTADGSTKTTTINPDGTSTVETDNAETGYHSVKTVAVDGSAVETEEVNGVTTVTETNADGVVTSMTSTSTNADGSENMTGYELNNDGSVTRTVQAGGIKTVTTESMDGTSEQVQSVVLDNGTTAETTTTFDANGRQTGDTSTVIKSSDGKSVISESVTSTGSDETGNYTLTTTTSAAGTVDHKDYGNGRTVVTETTASGDVVTTEAHAGTNGSVAYTITETDASSGETKTTNITNSGAGMTVTTDADGNVIGRDSIERGRDGSISYVIASGGSFSMAETGNGADASRTATVTYSSGGSDIISVNKQTGDTTTTSVDSTGSTSTVTVNAKTGATTVDAVRADGSTVQAMTDANGGYTETVTQANGGVRTTVRTSSGEAGVEKTTYSDGAGNTSSVRMEGDNVVYRSGTSSDGSSYSQSYDKTADSWTTTQNLASGDAVTTVKQADGCYSRNIEYANGASRTETLDAVNGTMSVSTVSASGITTTTTQSAAGVVSSVQTGSMGIDEHIDNTSGVISRTLSVAGQQYSMVTQPDGSSITSFTLPNNAACSYTTMSDGSQVSTIRQADGSSRTETVASNGSSSIVYTDSKGSVVTESNAVTRLNDAYASSVASFNSGMQSVREGMSAFNLSGTSTLSSAGISSQTISLDGQDYNITRMANGSCAASFQMDNGAKGVYGVGADGSQIYTVRSSNGSSRVETVYSSGDSSVIYRNSSGDIITQQSEITQLDNSYAGMMTMFSSGINAVQETMGSMGVDSDISIGSMRTGSLNAFEIPAPTVNMTMTGISENAAFASGNTSGIMPGTPDEVFNDMLFRSMTEGIDMDALMASASVTSGTQATGQSGSYGRYDTWSGGSATNNSSDDK